MKRKELPESLYEADFVAWLDEQAKALRNGRPEQVDWANLAEEIEGLARRQRQELRSRLRVLLTHLLKVHYQAGEARRSWLSTIFHQREEMRELLEDSPSLRSLMPAYLESQYTSARRAAAIETGLGIEAFPAHCPFSLATVLTGEDGRPSS